VELDHAIGYSGEIHNSALLHPNRKNYLHITGAHVAISNLDDSPEQSFLRGHDDLVTCLAVSSTGRLVASGQQGYNADVYVWDFESRSMMYRFSEHDNLV
jgi:WD40 repeat protein